MCLDRAVVTSNHDLWVYNSAVHSRVPFDNSRSTVKTNTRSPTCTSISVKRAGTLAPLMSLIYSQSWSRPWAVRLCRNRLPTSTPSSVLASWRSAGVRTPFNRTIRSRTTKARTSSGPHPRKSYSNETLGKENRAEDLNGALKHSRDDLADRCLGSPNDDGPRKDGRV